MQNKLSTPLGLNKWLLLSPHLNVQNESTKVCSAYPFCTINKKYKNQKKLEQKLWKSTETEEKTRDTDAWDAQDTEANIYSDYCEKEQG